MSPGKVIEVSLKEELEDRPVIFTMRKTWEPGRATIIQQGP